MENTSLYRLRLSSIELMEVSDELLNVMKKYENRIANHLHIQHNHLLNLSVHLCQRNPK